MRVLYLGPTSPVLSYLRAIETGEVAQFEHPISTDHAGLLARYDWWVSFGYRHVISAAVLDCFAGRGLNLHISLLPWNRGADPNLWSWIDDTPKGVTIHRLSRRLDGGHVLAQHEVPFGRSETLATSYARLHAEMYTLFWSFWPQIRDGLVSGTPQPKGGSYHRAADRATVEHLLTHGWDTPVSRLTNAKEHAA